MRLLAKAVLAITLGTALGLIILCAAVLWLASGFDADEWDE